MIREPHDAHEQPSSWVDRVDG